MRSAWYRALQWTRYGALRVAWRLLRDEGGVSLVARAADHRAEARRRRGFSTVAPSSLPPGPFSVLQLAATAPVPWFGGTQIQLRQRLEEERAVRPLALLYPDGGGLRLELERDGERWAADLATPIGPETALENEPLEARLRELVERLGARALHLEGITGLPIASLRRLAEGGMPLVVSLHDFGAFCPRPHLLELPFARFCEYSRDPERCGRCLAQSWPLDGAWQLARRAEAAALLTRAALLVFPSAFLARTHGELFPELAATPRRIVAPAPPPARAPRAVWRDRPGATPSPVRHVALLGGARAHKGARELVALVGEMRRRGLRVRWSVYGGGEPEHLAALAREGVRRVGYYRRGTLAARLGRERVDLALLLSIVPETYSLVLDECVAASVPVVAFAAGALAERLPALGAGWLVPPESGAPGVAELLALAIEHGLAALPPRPRSDPPPTEPSGAAGYLALYRDLGLI